MSARPDRRTRYTASMNHSQEQAEALFDAWCKLENSAREMVREGYRLSARDAARAARRLIAMFGRRWEHLGPQFGRQEFAR